MSDNATLRPLFSRRSGPLQGTLSVPGDKSISHRAIILGGIAAGATSIRGLLEGDDVLCTIAAMKALGAGVTKDGDVWYIEGTGLENLKEPSKILDMGNSGTAARLLIGLLSAKPFTSFFVGDDSLNKRPMARVMTPLEQMGAQFTCRSGGRLPLGVVGAANPAPIVYRSPVASAQVKSAVLLAGLSTDGVTTVIEKFPTRDHTEIMFRQFGANVTTEVTADGAEAISVVGKAKLTGQNIIVPSDPSSAAFPLVAASLCPGSAITLRNVCVNSRRSGIITSLQEMGASIVLSNQRDVGGEQVADIMVQASPLHAITINPDRVPSMIDEFPVLAVAASCAVGVSRFRGLGELRVKESDRLALIAEGLKANGADVSIEGDDLIINGSGLPPKGGAVVATAMDHRIAMSFLVLGAVTIDRIGVDDGSMISTSFPGFVEMMNGIGMNLSI
ncbi:MAG: 3-phosphoshikimate 1-carboxyvinyltransferase [Alphaproteobacteria bacterium]|nr:3-phosphoshikimate 1-carboxyvinyltransferase [Alphaproteobacteria bacterium]